VLEQLTNVLVIEDNPGDADLIRALFEEASGERFNVETADRLQTGLRRLSLGAVDLVLLDLSLPDSQGIATLHAAVQAAPEVPVVVMTGLDDEALALEAMKQGAQDYLVKGRVGSVLLARTARYAIERSRSQRTLRESHRLTQQLVDTLYIYDSAHQRIVYGSPRFCALLGEDPNGIASTRPSLSKELVHPEDRSRFAKHIETLSGADAPEEVEGQFRIKIANGNWRWLQARETVFTRDAGRPSLILGTAYDVTKQKELEERVAELEEQARQLQAPPANSGIQARYSELDDFAPDMMALVDMVSGKVVQCNEAFAEAAGQRKEDLLGRTREEISHSGASETVRAALAAVETETETDLMLLRPDGSQVRLLHRATPVRDEVGRVVAKRAVWRDVTEIRRVEQAMAQQSQELARAQADLADFAYIASHDLKEPLRGISNYAGFLLEDHADTIDEKAKVRLETIVRLAKRQEELVDTLLHYSELGTGEAARKRVDLQTVLQRAIDLLQPLARQANADIRVAKPLPTIECDAALVLELFSHLISNAIRFNDKAQKRVEIGFESAQEKGPGPGLPAAPFVFHVRDNGIGISEKHRAAIFQFLKRLHGRDEYGGGVGAGLAIVGKIVEKHRGKIWLQSDPGEGTTFYFTLQGEGN